MANVEINLEEMTATVTPRVHDKYARKLLQDKLKADTLFKGGWYCSIQNLYDDDADHYEFELYNSDYSLWTALKMIQGMS
jgi:hypothetical protein